MSADNPPGTDETDKPAPVTAPPAADSSYGSGGEDDPTLTQDDAWDEAQAADRASSSGSGYGASSHDTGYGSDGSRDGQSGSGQYDGSGQGSGSGSEGGDEPEASGYGGDGGGEPGHGRIAYEGQERGSATVPGTAETDAPVTPQGTFSTDSNYGSGGPDDPTLTGEDAWSEALAADADPGGHDAGYDREDPSPGRESQDGAAGTPGSTEEAGSSAGRQRAAREAQEQPAAPAPGREQEEADASGTESRNNQRQEADSSEQVTREIPPVPQRDLSNASQNVLADADSPADAAELGTDVPEARDQAAATALPPETDTAAEPGNTRNSADANPVAAQASDIPVTPAASSNGEQSEEQQSPPAERPEDPVASLVPPDTDGGQPETAQPDPHAAAQREDPLAALTAEPATGGDTETGETTAVPEAEAAQVSTAEHDPQTRDPEPVPETALPPGEQPSAANGTTEQGGENGGDGGSDSGAAQKSPDGAENKNLRLHWTSEFSDGLEIYSDTDGTFTHPELRKRRGEGFFHVAVHPAGQRRDPGV